MWARRGRRARAVLGLLACSAMAAGLLAGAPGGGGSEVGTSISAVRKLSSSTYLSWQAAQDGVYGIVFTTESCKDCAQQLNAIEATHFALQQSSPGNVIPWAELDAEPEHSGMGWAMEELGLEQKFPAFVIFKGGVNEDKEVIFKHIGFLSKSLMYNLVMKLTGEFLFPKSIKDVSKQIRRSAHATFIYAEDPEDPDAARKEDMMVQLVDKHRTLQVQKVGGKGKNAKDWGKIKTKFGISQTCFIASDAEFNAHLLGNTTNGKPQHAVFSSFESFDALENFHFGNSVSLVHWDDNGDNSMLALDKYAWAREDPKRLGSDGLVTFWYNHADKRSMTQTLTRSIAPLARKFPNLIFLVKLLPAMSLEPCYDNDKKMWMYTLPEINAIGIADIITARPALKVTLDYLPAGGSGIFDSTELLFNKPLRSRKKGERKYPKDWGIPQEEKGRSRGTSFDEEEVAQKLQQLLRDRSPEL